MTITHITLHHDGVTIPVSRGGRGRPLVLCPGLCPTRPDLEELTGHLRRDFEVTTFDLRGFGDASPAERYSVDAFRRDLAAVLADLGRPAVLVGYSLGADLVVQHASEHPEDVIELVCLDGANPLPEPFVADVDLETFRAIRETPGDGRTALTPQQQFTLDLEIDVVRAGILDRYRRIDRPISMIMSTTVGGGVEGRALRHNRLWLAGVERLVRERPDVAVSWVDADHRLVITHAAEVAGLIGGTLARC